jgi:hypothetical protein
MDVSEAIAIPVVVGTVSGLAGWVTWVVADNVRRARTSRIRAEVQTKLLDRFGNSQELLAYLQTEAGKQFLESSTPDPAPNPFSRILIALQAGVILLLFGLSLLLLRTTQTDTDTLQALLFLGTPTSAIGLGFIGAGTLSYLLSKNWGLFDRHNGR